MSAWVQHNRILFIANKPPVGEEQTEVVVFSNNKEPTGYDSNNPDEWESGKSVSVTIDHWVNIQHKDIPIVFASLQREETPAPPLGVHQRGPPCSHFSTRSHSSVVINRGNTPRLAGQVASRTGAHL